MGSRCFIGRVDGDKVRYVFCHKGSYLDSDGYGHILLNHYCTAEKADSLINQGSICDIEDNGRVMSYHEQDGRDVHVSVLPLEEFRAFDETGIETLYLWEDGRGWMVKSRMHMEKPFSCGFWYQLQAVLEARDKMALMREARDNLSEQARKALLLVAEFKDFLDVYKSGADMNNQLNYEADDLLHRADLLLE